MVASRGGRPVEAVQNERGSVLMCEKKLRVRCFVPERIYTACIYSLQPIICRINPSSEFIGIVFFFGRKRVLYV